MEKVIVIPEPEWIKEAMRWKIQLQFDRCPNNIDPPHHSAPKKMGTLYIYPENPRLGPESVTFPAPGQSPGGNLSQGLSLTV